MQYPYQHERQYREMEILPKKTQILIDMLRAFKISFDFSKCKTLMTEESTMQSFRYYQLSKDVISSSNGSNFTEKTILDFSDIPCQDQGVARIRIFKQRQILISGFVEKPTMIIKQLSQKTAEELCAQQVITSLPDCIKELVDNSIDASSTYIRVVLHEYGKQKVEVIDNGLGISDFDFLGKKGSTSKNKGNDQFNYLGFRGEAIHSIGRVSGSMTIQSKNSIDGYRRVFNVNTLALEVFKQQRLCHGEFNFQISNLQSFRNTGTKVTINDIFKNLPVRHIELHSKYKEFLKKTNELIKQYCLMYPEIQFIFINTREGKPETIIQTTSLKTFSRSNWLDRIKQVDERIGNSLVYINGQFFQGYVLNKIESGSSRQNNFIKKNYHYLYLNKRPIDVINVLLLTFNEIYKKYNNNTKYAFIINLKLKHEMMDVNLTPNKREVFVRKEILERIVKDLKEKITQKVIEEIPTLSNYEDKKRMSQNQPRMSSSQPSTLDHFCQKEIQPPLSRNTISFKPKDETQVQRHSLNNPQQVSIADKAETSYGGFREGLNTNRNSFNENLNNKIQQGKSALLNNKQSKSSIDLVQLPKVNININKLKQTLNSRLTLNKDGLKRISAPKYQDNESQVSVPLGENVQPIHPAQIEQYRKQNQQKKIRQEQEDAKRRAQFLKEVKIQYNGQQIKKPKPIIQSSHLNLPQQKIARKSFNKQEQMKLSNQIRSPKTRQTHPRQDLMEQEINRSKQIQIQDNQFDECSQSFNDDVQQLPSKAVRTIQPSDKELQSRIKAKINIDMSQIFVKFNNKKSQQQQRIPIDNTQQEARQESASQNVIQIDQNEQQIADVCQQIVAMVDGKGNPTKQSIQKEDFRHFEVIGQFNKGFILCAYNHQYFLVDQHAASQKFHYQRFLSKSSRLQSIKSDETQQITAIQADQIQEAKILLTQAGFYYNIVGRNRLELLRCPVFYQTKLGLEYFWQIIGQKKQLHRIPKFTAMCAMKACKTAVVVGNTLSHRQMAGIVAELANLESPWNCPHGRPTLVQLGRREALRSKVVLGRANKKYEL